MAKVKKTSADNYIFSYYQQIQNGKIIVGEYIKQIYSYIIQGLESKSFLFDKVKADNAINWIENHCYHLEGKKATTPLTLELWQKAFISVMFGIVDNNGLRHFREFFVV